MLLCVALLKNMYGVQKAFVQAVHSAWTFVMQVIESGHSKSSQVTLMHFEQSTLLSEELVSVAGCLLSLPLGRDDPAM
jgi:hypothetical protein